MPNPRLAARYAKSLIGLSTEKGQLEKVYEDMQFLQAVCKQSREFVNLLRSPVVKGDKKNAILTAITKGKVSPITEGFNRLLIAKGRESDLPEIASAFVDQYNTIKGIHKISLTTAVDVSDAIKNEITSKVKTGSGIENIELETKTDPAIIGGFVLEFNNNLVDASVRRELRDIKKQFSGNLYEHNIH